MPHPLRILLAHSGRCVGTLRTESSPLKCASLSCVRCPGVDSNRRNLDEVQQDLEIRDWLQRLAAGLV
jgi:hypothetical protein